MVTKVNGIKVRNAAEAVVRGFKLSPSAKKERNREQIIYHQQCANDISAYMYFLDVNGFTKKHLGFATSYTKRAILSFIDTGSYKGCKSNLGRNFWRRVLEAHELLISG